MKNIFTAFVILCLLGCQTGLKEDKNIDARDSKTAAGLVAASPDKSERNEDVTLKGNLKGKWILAGFYDKVKEKREFWTIDGFPISWFSDIVIKDTSLVAKGWHEEAELKFEWTSPTSLKTTDDPSQYFVIKYDKETNRITAEEIYNNKSRWKHTYKRVEQANSPDMSNVAQIIKKYCLVGKYRDLTQNQLTEINNSRLAEFTYKVETDYEHICSKLNILTLEKSDSVIVSSWDWNGDTLKINRLIGTEEEEGCYTYKKGELIKKLLLTTTAKKH